jgi:hypothetical protein
MFFLEYAGGLHIIALREGELGQNSRTKNTSTHTHPHTPTSLCPEHWAKLVQYYIIHRIHVVHDQLDQLPTTRRGA